MKINGYGDRIKVLCEALSNKSGEAELHIDPRRSGTHSLIRSRHQGSSQSVRVSRLDAICLEFGIRRVDIAKIDVEGAEEQVLNGMQAIESWPRIMFVDLHPRQLRVLGSSGRGIADLLSRKGYSLYSIRPKGLLGPFEGEPHGREMLAIQRNDDEAMTLAQLRAPLAYAPRVSRPKS